MMNIFQGIRLYEVFGESGPQAVLQMSIAFRIVMSLGSWMHKYINVVVNDNWIHAVAVRGPAFERHLYNQLLLIA